LEEINLEGERKRERTRVIERHRCTRTGAFKADDLPKVMAGLLLRF
jgi:hypothetical protein